MLRIFKLVISIFYSFIIRLRSLLEKLTGRQLPDICVVLYYHAIKPEQRRQFARQMDDLVKRAKTVRAGVEGPLREGAGHVAVTFDDGLAGLIDNALPELVLRNIPATIFIPTGYLGRRPQWEVDIGSAEDSEPVMTADQLRQLPPDLVSIGSHTRTHPRLTLLSQGEALAEFCESRRELEEILERDIKLFSFPYGEYNQNLVEAARGAGYERLFTIMPVVAFSEPKEFVTGRVRAAPSDWRLEFRLKIMGAYCWLPLAFSLKRKIKEYRGRITKGLRV
jgi:peptidoglycan/xylan/chitin deacetylase (PgdA/CDA1 family)